MTELREVLPGSRKSPAAGARLIGRTDPDQLVHVTVVLNRANDVPDDVLRRHALTRPHDRPKTDPGALWPQYGATPESIDAIREFAARHGLSVTHVDAARRVVELSGTASNMEQAFGTQLHDSAVGPHTYRSRRGPILLPAEIQPRVEAVLGLDNRPVAQPRLRPRVVGTGYYPGQIASFYGFPAGDGAGQTIALIELGGNLGEADLDNYFKAAGLNSAPTVRSVNVGSHKPVPYGTDTRSDGEVMLDIEVVGAMAPAATIVVYFADNTDQGFYDAASLAVHDPATTAVSISWGSAEKGWSEQSMEAWRSLGETATLLNIPIFVAAGDSGCSDEFDDDPGYDGQRHVDFPGSCSQGVICCGGTRLDADRTGIKSETVWNQGDGWATGGGVSTYFQVPEWQSGRFAETGASLLMRGVPDVAGVADQRTGIKVRSNGEDGVSGGTSAVAPQWAALTAILSQKLGRRAGFFLPLLYQQAAAKATRDIVTGDNSVYGLTGYLAHPGWNACTGLGSPDGNALFALLSAGAGPLQVNPTQTVDQPTVAPTSLDTTFRAAVVSFDAEQAASYGKFVRSAYSMYDANPNNKTPDPSADFPPDFDLVAWVVMQDFILGSTAPTFYGIIARSQKDPDAFVLAIRGTANGVEWWDDANSVVKTPFKVPGCGSVGSGFARIYDTLEVIERPGTSAVAPHSANSLRAVGSFVQQVANLVQRHTAASARVAGIPPAGTVEVTGHSLGAALATLYAMENAKSSQIQTLSLCTFASPLVGDSTFAGVFNALPITSWRIVNKPDIVPKLPPSILGFKHVNALQQFNSAGSVKATLACWHAMTTYLSLLDHSVQPSSSCRAAAVSIDDAVQTAAVTGLRRSVQSIPVPLRGGNVTVTINVVDNEAAA